MPRVRTGRSTYKQNQSSILKLIVHVSERQAAGQVISLYIYSMDAVPMVHSSTFTACLYPHNCCPMLHDCICWSLTTPPDRLRLART